MNENLYQLKEDFLKEWPENRIKNLSLEEYSNLNKTSFTYWLESVTTPLGSIWGGSSYKFGIYRRRDQITDVKAAHLKTDGTYAWYAKYGASAPEAFQKVLDKIQKIISSIKNNNLENIDNIDLGDAYKWKIAFLYSDFNVVNIFKLEALKFAAEFLGIENPSTSFSELNRYIISGKENQDYFDFTHQLWREYESPSEEIVEDSKEKTQNSLNQIFFGPPGTGKTYNSISRAIQVCDPQFYESNKFNRNKLTERFKELLINDWEEPKGQIAFCTFHQSFSYEDFVEGIKPKVNDDKNVYYEIEPGVFKKICDLANSSKSSAKVKQEGKVAWSSTDFKRRKSEFFKLSLGEAKNVEDRAIYEFCIKKDYIAIGFGGNKDFSGMNETEIREYCNEHDENSSAGSQLSTFIHGLQRGSYVLISKGNQFVRALGRVVGEYEYHDDDDFPIRYNHFKKVEWIFKDENIPAEELYEVPLTQRSIYKIDEDKLKEDFFVHDGVEVFGEEPTTKPYILIIDEINRGNISSIFGELITLIEKDKRSGGSEELSVTLPYSKENFKVPDNVFLLGTMNTADRSIEALDTALRRRFSFTEFPPHPELVISEAASGKKFGIIEGIELKILLEAINKRIEKLIDKDHRIGHSYFLKVDSLSKLRAAFKDEIIPLLEEYFFGDYGKIGLVLGSSFIEKQNHDFDFASFEGYDTDVKEDLKEKAVYTICEEEKWNFKSVYQS